MKNNLQQVIVEQTERRRQAELRMRRNEHLMQFVQTTIMLQAQVDASNLRRAMFVKDWSPEMFDTTNYFEKANKMLKKL